MRFGATKSQIPDCHSLAAQELEWNQNIVLTLTENRNTDGQSNPKMRSTDWLSQFPGKITKTIDIFFYPRRSHHKNRRQLQRERAFMHLGCDTKKVHLI